MRGGDTVGLVSTHASHPPSAGRNRHPFVWGARPMAVVGQATGARLIAS
jgi:hypothetical protein